MNKNWKLTALWNL